MIRSGSPGPAALGLPIHVFRLYVAGNEHNSRVARENLRSICDDHLRDCYRIEEVDVLKDFKSALEDRIFVTPTLVLVKPAPSVTIIGSLGDSEKVLSVLRLKTGKHGKKES
jgi:circadian clock protein KaiB